MYCFGPFLFNSIAHFDCSLSLRKSSKFAPVEGFRYDGIYKVTYGTSAPMVRDDARSTYKG